MPIAAFKATFTVYDILMYSTAWKKSSFGLRGTGRAFAKTISNSANQEVVFTLDYQGKRQLPPGCKQDKVYFNLYVQDLSNRGRIIAHKPCMHSMGYGSARVHLSGKNRYRLLVYNWADTSVNIDVTLTTWAKSAPVRLG